MRGLLLLTIDFRFSSVNLVIAACLYIIIDLRMKRSDECSEKHVFGYSMLFFIALNGERF